MTPVFPVLTVALSGPFSERVLVGIARLIERNNQLVAAGVLDPGVGRVAVKVPGTIDDIEDVLSTPVAVDRNAVLTVADLAEVRQNF